MFSSKEDALKFLEKRDLDEARIKLLIELNRIVEAAGIHAKNGDMLKAVQTLSAPAIRSVDYVRPTIEYLLAGLWRSLTIGMLATPNTIASKLLARKDALEKSAMTGQEVDEVSPPHSFNQRLTPAPPACDV